MIKDNVWKCFCSGIAYAQHRPDLPMMNEWTDEDEQKIYLEFKEFMQKLIDKQNLQKEK